jgi:hypothetical protein
MVKKVLTLAILAFILILSAALMSGANAQTRAYHLEHEWAQIWINQDGTVDVFYDIRLTLDSGDSISKVFVGQPKRDFTIGSATDEYGIPLTATDQSSGSDYRVQVTLSWPLSVGESVKFNLTTCSTTTR